MKVSLCMIVKNEGKNLRRCLESVATAVDEIIIVDTGSTDNTCEIAREFEARVESFAWNGSFSDARNRSLELATGDWVLVLDADEELAPESGGIMRRLIKKQRISGYFLRIESYVGGNGIIEMSPDIVFRLFRNKPEHRFRGAIHEQIADVIIENNKATQFVVAEDIVIRHYGFLDQQMVEKDKKNRNLRMIEEHIQKNSDDKLLRFHYGVELYRVEKYEQAAAEFTKAADGIDKSTSYLPKLVRYIVLCYYNDKKYENGLKVAQQGLEWFPNYADLHYYQGLIYIAQKEYGLAYASFSKAVTMPDQPSHYAPTSGTKGFRAYYHLGQIAELFCNQEEALRNYILSLQDNAAFTASLDCICRILEPRVDAAYAQQALEKICEFSTPVANSCVAELLMKQSAYPLAYEYYENATKGMAEESATIKINKAVCLVQQRRFTEALSKLEDISPEEPLYPAAMFNKIFCWWVQGCQQEVRRVVKDITGLRLAEDSAGVVGILAHNLGNRIFPQVNLGKEGISILQDVFKRTVDLGEWERATTLLDGVTPESRNELSLAVGEICFNYGNLELAKQYVDSYLAQNSESEAAYFLLAQVKEGQKLYLDAQYCYRQAMSLEPKNPKNYVRLAELYDVMRQDIVRQAMEKYQDAPVLREVLEEASK